MKKLRMMMFLSVLVVSLIVAGVSLAADIRPEEIPPASSENSAGAAPATEVNGDIDSLSGSNVVFYPGAGGDNCYIPGTSQTFCFRAESFTPDYAYIYNLWQKFPTNWTVTDVYTQGTPVCDSGTWGPFSWTFQTSPYEVNIAHSRYQATTDHCVAYYCFDVTSGAGATDALASWYWSGDDYGALPEHPCSNDNYTPAGQHACDEAIAPQAAIPLCAPLSLDPPNVTAQGCNGTSQTHEFSLLNNTGSDGTFAMTYSAPQDKATLTGPPTIHANSGETVDFAVTLTPNVCNFEPIVATIEASGNGNSDTATITKSIHGEPTWEDKPNSNPTWGGTGYPRDGCTAHNAAGELVTYLIGETSSIFGFWGYNHTTNAWFQPNPTGTPIDRWAPDWAYDPSTNKCYLTGGANAPGGGTYTEAYVFDPIANTFQALHNFTSPRDFHNSWVGTINGVKYLCLGGGINVGSVLVRSTQCFDLSQALPGVWNNENAQMGLFPTDPFGAADGVLHAATGDQFWYVGGAINNSVTVTDEARYWDDADNSWHFAGNTGVPRYRVEGDFLNGKFYQLGGATSGFLGTSDVVQGRFNGANWVWTLQTPMNLARMDNVVSVDDATIWSIDGYGDLSSNYVEQLHFCPTCPPASIVVEALPLRVYQPPNRQSNFPIQICNAGGARLSWSILENATYFGGSMPFIPVSVEPSGPAPEGMSISSSPDQLGIPVDSANPDAVLWDQPLSAVSQAAWVDQEFPDFPSYSSFLADDFISTEVWTIRNIFVPGDGWNGFTTLMNASLLTWQIYADEAGFPAGDPSGGGDAPLWTLSLAPNNPQVTITNGTPGGMPSSVMLSPSVPIVVPPGTYWFIFYPTLSFGSYGQYGRQAADTTNGNIAKLINPGGAFGYGMEWQNWNILGPQATDIAFRLEGDRLDVVPWLSEIPPFGMTAGDACSPVNIRFDSTGLSFGEYTASLSVVSNDEITPSINLPVTLNVSNFRFYLSMVLTR